MCFALWCKGFVAAATMAAAAAATKDFHLTSTREKLDYWDCVGLTANGSTLSTDSLQDAHTLHPPGLFHREHTLKKQVSGTRTQSLADLVATKPTMKLNMWPRISYRKPSQAELEDLLLQNLTYFQRNNPNLVSECQNLTLKVPVPYYYRREQGLHLNLTLQLKLSYLHGRQNTAII